MRVSLLVLIACSDTEPPEAVDSATPCAELPWYPDADGDGWGTGAGVVAACVAPAAHAELSGDCDDNDATLHPSVSETCDGIDNDCDGLVDDADGAVEGAGTWYLDQDGDGYGGAAYPIAACLAPAGASAEAADCDDRDPAVSPAADEVCDGLDNDCNGEIDPFDPTDATWSGRYEANFRGSSMNYSFDVTCSGPVDLAVSEDGIWSVVATMSEPCCESTFATCFQLEFDAEVEVDASIDGHVVWSGGEDGELSGWWTEPTCSQGALMEADFTAVLYPVGFWTYTWVSGTLSVASVPG